ncbi:MAG: SDR family oxidoreductase, partial [Verrucomicrobia bacterium]|nr:SDR family oxidoreductase [Verrucomicrobiota bacterium]
TEGTTTSGITESDLRKEAEKATPLGRIGYPDDVALVAGFLASDESRWVTGEIVHVAGGYR